MGHNVLQQIIGENKLDSIKVAHEESQDFKSFDAWDFYGIYITSQDCNANCERCYSNAITNCYKCVEGYVLKGMTCVFADSKTYLKIPCGKKIQFRIDDQVPNYYGRIREFPGITITFYMKFEGAYQGMSGEETNYRIVELKSNTYLAYEPVNANLEFYIESNVGFRYSNYYNLIGQWIPYSIAIYVGQSPVPNRYPHMFTFSVNKEDIPFVSGFTLPDSLTRINKINLGQEIIALFAELRIYGTFIQGSFGISKSAKSEEGLILYYPLIGSSDTDCVNNDMLSNKEIVATCVTDYTDYIGKNCGSDTTKYFDLSIPGESPCASCPDYCKTKCFNPNNNQCTCDLTHGLYWLRRDKTSRQTYCEYLPYIDYSILNDTEIKVPVSKTLESTVEFWVFIYSYNSTTSQFTNISIEWNLHNRVYIINRENTLYANCYAFYDMSDEEKYTELLSLSISGYSWIYIRCGTDYVSESKRYFLNNQEGELKVTDYPSRINNVTNFRIRSGTPSSFGYVFLKDIKLWQQYNFNYINTQYINLIDDVGLYDVSILKSAGIYPGLITYIKSDFDPAEYNKTLTAQNYTLINLIGKDDLGYAYPRTYTI